MNHFSNLYITSNGKWSRSKWVLRHTLHEPRYDFPKVQVFEKILDIPTRHRPPVFTLRESFDDSMWEFVSNLHVGHVLPDEPEEKLNCQTTIWKSIRVGGKDMMLILEKKGCFVDGIVE
jgi:hypothetical protein